MDSLYLNLIGSLMQKACPLRRKFCLERVGGRTLTANANARRPPCLPQLEFDFDVD